MNKKSDLMSGFGEKLSRKNPTPKQEEQKLSRQEIERRSRVGRKASWDKSPRITDTYAYTSLALDEQAYEQIREIARLNGLPLRDVVNAALRKYVELYESKNGRLRPLGDSKISADSLV